MDSMQLIRQCLEPQLKKIGITLNKNQYNQIYKYYDLLLEWNKVMNLTTITDEIDFANKHIYDSVLIHSVFDMNEVDSIIDVGTGAGLPGIPLKIVFPHLRMTLLDSLNKRVKFLNQVIQELNLDNMEPIHGRAEDFGKDLVYRESFDCCVSRAVSDLSILSEYCLPFVHETGYFIAYKSIDTDSEIEKARNPISILGGKISSIEEVELQDQQVIRRFVIIDKITTTPIKYPRKAGKPQKSPLK